MIKRETKVLLKIIIIRINNNRIKRKSKVMATKRTKMMMKKKKKKKFKKNQENILKKIQKTEEVHCLISNINNPNKIKRKILRVQDRIKLILAVVALAAAHYPIKIIIKSRNLNYYFLHWEEVKIRVKRVLILNRNNKLCL